MTETTDSNGKIRSTEQVPESTALAGLYGLYSGSRFIFTGIKVLSDRSTVPVTGSTLLSDGSSLQGAGIKVLSAGSRSLSRIQAHCLTYY